MDYSAQTKAYQGIISLYNIDLKNAHLYTALLNNMYPTKKHMFEILPNESELDTDTHTVIDVDTELNQTYIEELIEVNEGIDTGIIYSSCEFINNENANI
jgi:hypothetical protein